MTNPLTISRLPTLLYALLVSLAFMTSAHAALELKEDAVEVQLEQIQRWPLGEGDSLVLRPCRGCELRTLQVTAATRYATGFAHDGASPALTLPETLRLKSTLRNDPTHTIVVFFRPDNHPDAGQVTRLILLADF